MTFGVYKVTGRREYRGHQPGSTFEAVLDVNAEARAVARGDIVVLGRFTPDLEPGSYTLPDGWPPGQQLSPVATEAPEGASLIEGGGG